MSGTFAYIREITFTFEGMPEPLFDSVSFGIGDGWTGVAGPNGCGKTTLLKLLTGLIVADFGSIHTPEPRYYCEQRTDTMPDDLRRLTGSADSEAWKIKSMLGIGDDWPSRWSTLSHGERKRCQIAAALFTNPALLAVDEPTNHLDTDSATVVLDALASFKGIGVLVSHDRRLLDTLCEMILFVDTPRVDLRRGNYTSAHGERERETADLLKQRENMKHSIRSLNRELASRRQRADASGKRRSKRTIASGDHDAKAKIDLARISGKDAIDGKRYRLMKSRIERLEDHRASLGYKKNQPLGVVFDDKRVKGVYPLILPAGSISLGGGKHLFFPDISIGEHERIGVTGGNGTGKSTFIRHLVANIPLSGDAVVYVPQEIPLETARLFLRHIGTMNGEELGEIMTIVSRLGSDPERLRDSAVPSPGEMRKLILAEGIRRQPAIIVMDEPTNHMDLPSIECLETALANCTCPMVLVSHDRTFLSKLATCSWRFGADSGGSGDCNVVESPGPPS